MYSNFNITHWDNFYRLGNNENIIVIYRIIKVFPEKGMEVTMKIRTFAMTLILTLAIWLISAPIMTGCGDGPVSDSNTNSVENIRPDPDTDSRSAYAPMNEIKAAVVEILGENYWPDRQLTEEELETETGITSDMYVEFLAEKQKVETDIDMMIIIKTKNEHLSQVETMLNDYREALMVKYRERPQELGKVEASRIEIVDSYICFVQLGANTEAAVKAGDEQVITQCQQENERAVDMIEKTILDQ